MRPKGITETPAATHLDKAWAELAEAIYKADQKFLEGHRPTRRQLEVITRLCARLGEIESKA